MNANTTITALYNSVSINQSPTREIDSLANHFQHENFFQLSIAQEARRRQLKDKFSRGFGGRVFLTQGILGMAEIEIPGIDIHFVEEGALGKYVANGAFKDSILIANNNDISLHGSLDTYINFFQGATETIVVAWDFDNHHWYPMSTIFATHSDMYFPAHPDYFSLLSRYNRCIAGPISAGVIQWSRSFLRENLEHILHAPRSDQPLGTHLFYDKFRFRTQAINTLANHYPASVGFQTVAYHKTPGIERLKRWCGHKAHWIVPVLNDIAIRLFDALITGGVPIVPDTLKYHPTIAALSEHVIFYRATDLMAPETVVSAAISKFDSGGVEKIAERHRLALDRHHVTACVETILKTVVAEFEIPLRAATG